MVVGYDGPSDGPSITSMPTTTDAATESDGPNIALLVAGAIAAYLIIGG